MFNHDNRFGLIERLFFRTRETVDLETPAKSAISVMVGLRFLFILGLVWAGCPALGLDPNRETVRSADRGLSLLSGSAIHRSLHVS